MTKQFSKKIRVYHWKRRKCIELFRLTCRRIEVFITKDIIHRHAAINYFPVTRKQGPEAEGSIFSPAAPSVLCSHGLRRSCLAHRSLLGAGTAQLHPRRLLSALQLGFHYSFLLPLLCSGSFFFLFLFFKV